MIASPNRAAPVRKRGRPKSLLVTWIFVVVTCPPHTSAGSPPDNDLPKPDVSLLLARDPVVGAELKLSDRQTEAVERALAELDTLVFTLRDDKSRSAARDLIKALRKADRRIKAALADDQYRRLQNIVLRAQGYQALFEIDTARRLDITDEQQKDIRELLKKTDRELAELRATAENQHDELIIAAIERTKQQAEDEINALLTPEQQKQWAQLRGAPFDLSKLAPPAPRPPELVGVSAWINTNGEPPTLESLRGKVVVVHFWHFADKACIANYPWYRDWYNTYAAKGLVVIGIHTPEFPEQQDIEAVTAQAQLNHLDFPIAIDNDAATWNAWANPTWPAIYLIDRTGCVRIWWYGKLNQPDVDGAKFLHGWIEQLLAT